MPTSKPTISIVIPVYNVQKERFRQTLESLRSQTNKDFEVCISDGGNNKIHDIVDEFSDDISIHYVSAKKQLGISDNTNNALKLATGRYLAFLDHDDRLDKNTIDSLCAEIHSSQADVIYTDECIIDESGKVLNSFYKPDFSLDLLYSQNYICHFLCVRRRLAEETGYFCSKYDGAQDYDFVLRLTEHTKKISHIPQILYQWLSQPDSTSTNADAKPYANDAGLKALNDHLERQYHGEAYAVKTDNLFVYHTIFKTFDKQKVEIIIPFRDGKDLTEACIESIIQHSGDYNYSITLIDNQSSALETKQWLEQITNTERIKILKANFEFNWSRLQNLGIEKSDADVFVFLNNDTLVLEDNWLQTLCSNALRKDIGVVGPLLLYGDNTIQHAGVVIGLDGYAGHLYQGMQPVHAGVNFISPMVPRNVTAVTGACMAISRVTLDKIGLFDDNFIICGSDVEICLRAYHAGLRNLYTPFTRLSHLESKTRSTYIPEIDFQLSQKAYQEFWDNGDPFFNKNLDLKSKIPRPEGAPVNKIQKHARESLYRKILRHTRKALKNNKAVVKAYRKLFHIDEKDRMLTNVRARDIQPFAIDCKDQKPRINLVVPTIAKEKTYGGIATALKFLASFDEDLYDKRIIVCDIPVRSEDLDAFPDYQLVNSLPDNPAQESHLQITDSCCTSPHTLVVSENDHFIATAWWTAQDLYPIVEWQRQHYHLEKPNNLIYLIQDFEPGFYPWSEHYVCADNTYRSDYPVTAVFNSRELKTYFIEHGYKFDRSYHFDPILNDHLKEHLVNDEKLPRKKQIIVYGRPSVPRNMFGFIVASLQQAFDGRTDACEWTILSLGEKHPAMRIANNVRLCSTGKLSLDEYARVMEESYLGISLMASPHPSYPPLEMSSFGVKTITNTFANKDLSAFNDNIISITKFDCEHIAQAIVRELDNYSPDDAHRVLDSSYVEAEDDQFLQIAQSITRDIRKS